MTDSDDRRELLAAARKYLAIKKAAATNVPGEGEKRPLLPPVQQVIDKVARMRALAAAKRQGTDDQT